MNELQRAVLLYDLLNGIRELPPDLQKEWYDSCMLAYPQDEEFLTLLYTMATNGKPC